MKIFGIKADELTYSTMIRGLLQAFDFTEVVRMLQDAYNSNLSLSEDLSTQIISDLNRCQSLNEAQRKMFTE